jgi:hypothetical protein
MYLGLKKQEKSGIIKEPNKITYYLHRTYKTNSFLQRAYYTLLAFSFFANEFDKNANSTGEI